MFCDDLVRGGIGDPSFSKRRFEPIRKRIAAAVKFQLAPDFAAAANELSVELDQIAKALPFCRLPYPEVWIEVAHNHRRHWVEGEPNREWQITPGRIGFLLTATKDDLSAWIAHLFWSIPRDDSGFGVTSSAASMSLLMDNSGCLPPVTKTPADKGASPHWQRASLKTKEILSKITQLMPPEYGMPMEGLIDDDFMNTLVKHASHDWAGEVQFIEATLALLNARNTSTTEFVDNSGHNRKRAKAGRHPMASHFVLKIHPRQKARVKEAKGDQGHTELRKHFVRGHWKVRDSGVFFWRPFQRGTVRAGEITKDYEVAL